MKKQLVTLCSIAALTSISQAAISITSTNLFGFDSTTSAVVDSEGVVISSGAGYVGVGTFIGLSDSDIQSLDAAGIVSAFAAVSSTNFNVADGLWNADLTNNGDTSAFAGQNIFTVVANNNSLNTSSDFLIYRHTALNSGTGTFIEDLPNDDAIVAQGAASTGTLLVGEHNNFTHDFGAGEVAAFNLVEVTAVPEPSSTALLGLGSVALLLRRRR